MVRKTSWRKLGTSVGPLRRSRKAKALGISPRVKSQCARRRGGWGRLSDEGPGHYNPDRSEGPWGRAVRRSKGGAQRAEASRLRAARRIEATGRTKGRSKLSREQGMPGGGLSCTERGQARSERPALKPYWGKPAVRNFRGGDGNVTMGAELRPSPKDGDKPSDPKARAPLLYPTKSGSRLRSESRT